MRIIFLDVDGVLNCDTTTDRVESYYGIDDDKVALLKEIVDETEAKIVLTSTWNRCWHKTDKKCQDAFANHLDKKLANYNLEVMESSYRSFFEERNNEILDYLTDHSQEITSFVIIDDINFNYTKYPLLKHSFIKTDAKYGLTSINKDSAIEILKKDGFNLDLHILQIANKISSLLNEHKEGRYIRALKIKDGVVTLECLPNIKESTIIGSNPKLKTNAHLIINGDCLYVGATTIANNITGLVIYKSVGKWCRNKIIDALLENDSLVSKYI